MSNFKKWFLQFLGRERDDIQPNEPMNSSDTPNVGRIAGQDEGYAGEQGGERRAAVEGK